MKGVKGVRREFGFGFAHGADPPIAFTAFTDIFRGHLFVFTALSDASLGWNLLFDRPLLTACQKLVKGRLRDPEEGTDNPRGKMAIRRQLAAGLLAH